MAGWHQQFWRGDQIICFFMPILPQTRPNNWWKGNESLSDVKCCVPCFVTIWCTDMEKYHEEHKPILHSEGTWPVKNAARLWDGLLLVETRLDDQSKKLLKQKLLVLYPVLVEKHKTLNSTRGVIICSQSDRCSDEEIQAPSDQFVSKAYCDYKI
jgi:hypothetical protein